MSNGLKNIVTLLLLFLVAFSLRWGYVVNTKINKPPIRADALEYVTIAQNLVTSHAYIYTHKGDTDYYPQRPPGYPFFLAAIYAFTGSMSPFYWTTLMLQCLLGAATVVLTYLLAGQVLSRPWAIATAMLAALSPHLISMCTFFLSECLYTFLLLLGIILTTVAFRKGTRVWFALAGVVLGLAILVRPPLALFPLLGVLPLYLCPNGVAEKSRKVVVIVFLLAAFSFLGSWTLWRQLTVGSDPSDRSQLKTAVVCGTYPSITFQDKPGMPYKEDPDYARLMAASYPEIVAHVISTIGQEPLRYLGWWTIGKPLMYWSWKDIMNDGINFFPVDYSWFDTSSVMNFDRWLMLKLHPLLVVAAFVTIPLLLKGHFAGLPEPAGVVVMLCLLLLGYFTVMFMILAPFARYALPLGPELYLLAVLSLRWLLAQGKQLLRRPSPAGLTVRS